MSQPAHPLPLLSRGMVAVLVAQFLSAFADNALLFAAIALLKTHAAPAWQTPLLQGVFVLSFIVLAPFVGSLADSWPKGRVMFVANGIKLAGAAGMIFGWPALWAYALVGLGAAAYSPAKYGILGELVGPEQLIKANSLMEGSTIVAILLGAVAGGFLADIAVNVALWVILASYLLAALVNLLIPRLPSLHPGAGFGVWALLIGFRHSLSTLMRNPDARFSLIGTSVFWGAGSVLRFMLVAWVPVALGILDNSTPANLSGVVAVGIALGAAAAGHLVTLARVNRSLPAGMLIGALIMALMQVNSLPPAVLLLVLIGFCGGFYVVPLNALLQTRGHESVGTGHAIAVQNFFENTMMLLLVGLYALLIGAGIDIVSVASLIGGLVLLSVTAIGILRWRHTPLHRV